MASVVSCCIQCATQDPKQKATQDVQLVSPAPDASLLLLRGWTDPKPIRTDALVGSGPYRSQATKNGTNLVVALATPRHLLRVWSVCICMSAPSQWRRVGENKTFPAEPENAPIVMATHKVCVICLCQAMLGKTIGPLLESSHMASVMTAHVLCVVGGCQATDSTLGKQDGPSGSQATCRLQWWHIRYVWCRCQSTDGALSKKILLWEQWPGVSQINGNGSFT